MSSFLEHLRALCNVSSCTWLRTAKTSIARSRTRCAPACVRWREEGAKFALRLTTHAAEHQREIFAILRRLQPIVRVKDVAIVTRFQDVEEVLSRDDVFDVPYEARMKLITDGENFFLGMANTPRYARDSSNTRLLARREDIATFIQPFVAEDRERHRRECQGLARFRRAALAGRAGSAGRQLLRAQRAERA